MKNSIRNRGILIGALVAAMLTGTLGQASAVNPWGIGAQTSTLPTGTVDERVYVTLPPLPALAARTAGTFIWLGGHSTSGGTLYLTQPELRAYDSDEWRVYFEVVHGSVQDEYFQTAMKCKANAQVFLYNAMLGDGRNFQDAEYNSGGTLCNAIGVSRYQDDHNYGTTYTKGFTTLESYDSTSSDFHSMNGQIKFTGFKTSTNYSSGTTRTLTADQSTNPSPPSCITSTGGSGINTITVNC